MQTVNVLVGGPVAQLPPDWQHLPGEWVGVDRGALHLIDAGIRPLFVVGDFDSLTPAELQRVEEAVSDRHYAKPEKDDTDTELALWLTFHDYHAESVRVLGISGGRMDHFLSNLLLPTQPRFAPYLAKLEYLDRQNHVLFLADGTRQLQPDAAYRYLGVVALGATQALTIRGAKYPLTDWSSDYPYSFASNEFLGDHSVTVSVNRGIIALIYSKDRVGQTQDN